MVAVSSLLVTSSGLACHSQRKLPFRIWNNTKIGFNDSSILPSISRRIPRGKTQFFLARSSPIKHLVSAGTNHRHLHVDNDLPEEPFWLSLIKETIWALRSLFLFLVEQPSQLKYIEWPSFNSTLKTALLTLVLVALLIVALSSVDSVLCYLLAVLQRRAP